MRNAKNIWIVALLPLLSFCSSKIDCDISSFRDLTLHPIHCSLRIPAYRIIDSVRYDLQTILSYNIKTSDSLVSINCFIKSYENDRNALFNIFQEMAFQKQEAEFGRDSLKKLTETYIEVDSIKVGYLKYLVQNSTEKFYEGRIFFYKNKQLVTIWLFEKYRDEKWNSQSVIDCILGSLKF
jgi:hypothetical protein